MRLVLLLLITFSCWATTIQITPTVTDFGTYFLYEYSVQIGDQSDGETGYQLTLSQLDGLVANSAFIGAPANWTFNADFSNNSIQWVSFSVSDDIGPSPLAGFSFRSLLGPGTVPYQLDLEYPNSDIFDPSLFGSTTGPSAVPEPGSWLMLGAGLAAILIRGKSRTKQLLLINFTFLALSPLSAAPSVSVKVQGSPAWAPDISVRAGKPAALDASGSTGQGPLSFNWQQLSGPSTLRWTGRNTAVPTVTGTVFGTYTVRVSVSDLNGGTTADLRFGAVATDDADVVTPPSSEFAMLFAPLQRWGKSPWPWQDERHRTLADGLIDRISNDSRYNGTDWDSARTGTISVSANSNIVTGSGTNFQVDFCGGAGNTAPPTPPARIDLVVWYPTPSGGFGRRNYDVKSCDSATQLTLKANYLTTAGTASGLSYSRWECPACWGNGSTNLNYYDTVLALYNLHYRSGRIEYLNAARQLALKWFRSPLLDEMRIFSFGGDIGSKISAPRILSLLGVEWFAFETGNTAVWNALYPVLDQRASATGVIGVNYDHREEAYNLAFVAAASRLALSPAKRTYYASAAQSAIANRWAPAFTPNGTFPEATIYSYASWTGFPGTVTVTNGSDIVTGQGTNWDSSWFDPSWYGKGSSFQVSSSPTSGDPVTYPNATWISATQLRLSRPYEGASGTGKGWQIAGLTGTGTQPFFVGMVARALDLTYRATGNAQARQLTIDVATWLLSQGVQASAKGFYYGRLFSSCEPIQDSLPWCSFDANSAEQVSGSRYLSGVILPALTSAYLYTKNQSFLPTIESLTGGALGKLGGPASDANYVQNLDYSLVDPAFKDLGFWFGFGGGSMWAAGRSDTPTANLLGR